MDEGPGRMDQPRSPSLMLAESLKRQVAYNQYASNIASFVHAASTDPRVSVASGSQEHPPLWNGDPLIKGKSRRTDCIDKIEHHRYKASPKGKEPMQQL